MTDTVRLSGMGTIISRGTRLAFLPDCTVCISDNSESTRPSGDSSKP